MTDERRLLVRMPRELFEGLRVAAAADQRSVSSWVRVVLAERLASRPRRRARRRAA